MEASPRAPVSLPDRLLDDLADRIARQLGSTARQSVIDLRTYSA